MLNIVNIKATDINDAWHQLILNAPDNARLFTIDKGSYVGQQRLEFDFINVQITHPHTRSLEPQMPQHMSSTPPPVAEGYIDEYLPYLFTAEIQDNELYTYGSRLRTPIDQIQHVIDTYKKHGYRNNQLVMNVGSSIDRTLEDPACLQLIDTRIQDNKLHFYVYFRSWDLWGGAASNLGGIQILKEFMADEIGVDYGETIATSKGAHYYGYCVDLVLQRSMKDKLKREI